MVDPALRPLKRFVTPSRPLQAFAASVASLQHIVAILQRTGR